EERRDWKAVAAAKLRHGRGLREKRISVDDHSSKNQPVGSKIVDYHLDERLDWVADLEVRASAVHRSQSAVDRIIHDELIMRMAAIRCFINSTAGWPVGSTFRVPAEPFERESSLRSDPIALGARIVSVVAAFDSAAPTDA